MSREGIKHAMSGIKGEKYVNLTYNIFLLFSIVNVIEQYVNIRTLFRFWPGGLRYGIDIEVNHCHICKMIITQDLIFDISQVVLLS